MCGISGVIRPAEDPSRAVGAMQLALAHRGPDAEGVETLAGATIAQRRLSIIDLSPTGAQPMWDQSRSACIVFNGEIYNFQALREECIRRGQRFRGTSDTEVILNLFLLDGEASWARLDGMFAFCLVDVRSGSAYLVRDPMGVKPLYFVERREGLVFASELGALIDAGVATEGIDRSALQAYLQFDYVPGPMSMLLGVKKLLGGEELRVSADGSTRTRTYATWEAAEEVPRSLEDALSAFDALMTEAVRRQLVADVPVGVFLSGGIDSTIVATHAAMGSGEPIHSFSMGFDEPGFDESPYFDLVASRIGTIHHRRIASASEALELVPRIAAITSEPVADGSIFPTYLLCRFARQEIKVALSGDGADELFGGYPTYGRQALAGALSAMPGMARRAFFAAVNALMPVSFGDLTLGYKARKFAAGLDPESLLRNHRWLGSFAPEELPLLVDDWSSESQNELRALILQTGDALRHRDPLERLLRDDQRFYMQDQVLVKVDRASMACSLEVRPPFLSEGVVKFARSLPADLKVHAGIHKRLLREWVARRHPSAIAKRPKKGFGAPLAIWFRGPLRELVGDVLSPSVVARQGLLRPARVTRLVEEHFSGRADRRKEIFNLMTLGLWLDHVAARSPSGSLTRSPAVDR